LKAEEVFYKIYQKENLLIAKLCHNRAGAYDNLHDYENALSEINVAIDIKSHLMSSNSKSVFASKARRISILIDQIMFADELLIDKFELCKSFINELKLDTINDIDLEEQIRKSRLREIEGMEQDLLSLNHNNTKERVIAYFRNKMNKIKICVEKGEVEGHLLDNFITSVQNVLQN
jgi:G3E family GTPase